MYAIMFCALIPSFQYSLNPSPWIVLCQDKRLKQNRPFIPRNSQQKCWPNLIFSNNYCCLNNFNTIILEWERLLTGKYTSEAAVVLMTSRFSCSLQQSSRPGTVISSFPRPREPGFPKEDFYLVRVRVRNATQSSDSKAMLASTEE